MIDNHFKHHTLITYASNSVVFGSGFVLIFFINKYAGVQTYGELTIIVSTAGIIASLLSAKSGEAVTRFFIREKVNRNLRSAKFIVLIGICIDLILGVVVFIFFYVLSNLIATKLLAKPNLSFAVWMYGFITISTFIRGAISGYFLSHESFKILNFIQVAESILKVLFLLISFFVLNKFEIEYIVYSYILSSVLVTFFTFIIFIKRFLKEFKIIRLAINLSLLKEYLNYNMKTFFSTTLAAGNNNIDNLILGYFTDTTQVGVYKTLKSILLPIYFISTPYVMITYSKLARLYNNKKYLEFKHLIININMNMLKIALPISVLLYLTFPNILVFLEIDYNGYHLTFLMLIINAIIALLLWWGRIFSLIVNPILNIQYGIFLFLYNLSIVVITTNIYKLNGLVFSILLSQLFLSILWRHNINNINK